MENIVLLIHIILAVVLIIVILIQRAEGGALGIGGGSDGMTPRGTGDALTRITAIIATLFIITSITLAIISMRSSDNSIKFDDLDIQEQIDNLEENLLEIPELN
ncbi:MAG: preprotein translocase subunit SecG [Candidatus Pelagibacterales bacterium]|jgi:preprotein translocase subunit SecG|tara:strand:- start:73 stop:384 length:312 start_codon:yes stop_codon:yes gene_type:complete